MRKSWTDERLDDFREDVGRRFDEVDRRFDKVDERMEAGFARIDAKFDALMRALFQVGFVLAAALIGLIATQL